MKKRSAGSMIKIFPLMMLFVVGAVGCGDKKRPESEEATFEETDVAAKETAEKTAEEKEADEHKAKAEKISAMFENSLHKTGAGMKHWYDMGSKAMIGMDYEKLDCKNCHVKGCESCHSDGDKYKVSVEKSACLKCHSRYKATATLDKTSGVVDPHAEMACTKCHPMSDMHGDGKEWVSMRDRNFLKADCLSCHQDGKEGARKFIADSASHSAHENLSCAACHTSNTIACLNCHFDNFLATGSRKGNFVKGKDWLLLVNYQGKVTSGTLMSIVNKGKKYATIAPYSTHSITAKGRVCSDCHENKAVEALSKSKSVALAKFKYGKMTMTSGVVPAVKGKVTVPFLDKDADGKWTEIKDGEEPIMTFSGYAEPISLEQLESLNQKVD